MQKSGHFKKRDEDPDVQISKNLSYLLRHGALKEGLSIDKAGFVPLNQILQLRFYRSRKITAEKIQHISDTNSKKRYEIKTEMDQNGNPTLYIRATQGHSLKLVEDDDLLVKIKEASEAPICVHGTYVQPWQFIQTQGLKTMSRNHVHFAIGYPGETGLISGMRQSCTIYIELDVEKALKDGMELFLSRNNVILSRGFDGVIPPQYFKKVVMRNDEGKYQEINRSEYKKASMDLQEETKENKDPPKLHKEEKKTSGGKTTMTGQAFKYLAILDFEAQCDKDKRLDVQEIIEFPVVIVDVENRKILDDKFHYYIKPEVHPKLDPFCIQLTGITQGKVDKGIPLKDALDKLDTFLREKGILNESFCFVTCGHWDLNSCLKRETQAKKIPVKGYMKSWINLKTSYPPIPGVKVRNPDMVEMLRLSNLELIGKHHSGIDDAVNIARVAVHLLEKGFKFQTSMVANAEY